MLPGTGIRSSQLLASVKLKDRITGKWQDVKDNVLAAEYADKAPESVNDNID